MILVDTSVWIDHARHTEAALVRLLEARLVLSHPFIAGELAMGEYAQRNSVLNHHRKLSQAFVAEHEEVLRFVARYALQGKDIGYIDAHLLVSVQLTPDATLWSKDKRLVAIATELSLAHPPEYLM